MIRCRRLYAVVLGVIFAFQLASCSPPEKTSTQPHRKPVVRVIQLGNHAVIDRVVTAFDVRIRQLYGTNVDLKYLNANFDSTAISVLSDQAVGANPDVIVGITTPVCMILRGANNGLYPFVFSFVSEPEDIGYFGAGSLPNVTGLSDRVEPRATLKLIRAAMPSAKNIGYILTKSDRSAATIHESFLKYAEEYGFQIRSVLVDGAEDVQKGSEMLAASSDLILFGGDNVIAGVIGVVIEAARNKKLPVFACDEQSVEKGAVMALSVPYEDMGSRTADYCGMIIGGAAPDKVPCEVFTGSRLVVNIKACQAVNLQPDNSILALAARVIN